MPRAKKKIKRGPGFINQAEYGRNGKITGGRSYAACRAIRAIRIRKEMTVQECARRAGVSIYAWYNWEGCWRSPLFRLHLAAQGLGVDQRTIERAMNNVEA